MTPAFPGASAPLRLLLAELPDADVRRVEVFLGVRSDRLRHDWRVVAEGPVDVYLHDADDLPTIPGRIEGPPLLVRVADAARAPEGDAALLARPLQYDAFVDMLAAAERRLRPGAAPGVPSSVPVAAPAAPVSPEALDTQRLRLRRWPAAAMLQSVRHGVRIASFISSRALTLAELAELSGVDRAQCRAFLATLQEAGLLRVEEAPAARAAPAPAASSPAATPAAKPDRGLLASLRQKLGLRPQGR